MTEISSNLFDSESRKNSQLSLPVLDLGEGRAAVLNYFRNTWQLTEELFSSLVSEEAYYRRPYHKTRHPLIFYYAHPVCFYVNKLLVSGLIEKPINQDFELLFETGVDEMTWDDLHENDKEIWPPLRNVRAYRDQVYDLVVNLIETHPAFDEPISQDKPTWSLAMAFEHERIHLETSSVLIRELPSELVAQPRNWPDHVKKLSNSQDESLLGSNFPRNQYIEVGPCSVALGKPEEWPTFGWDNEYGTDERKVESFAASKFLISNGEFFQFVKSGGYEDIKYWSESGWGWRIFRNTKWPTFWKQDGPSGSNRFRLRTIFAEVPMQWDWPVIVNYYEAKAYCSWLSQQEKNKLNFRLLQESEHLAIRDRNFSHEEVLASKGDFCSSSAQTFVSDNQQAFNHNLRFGSESPVDAIPANDKGFHDTFGNVWQWCEDSFHPLRNFKIHPYYTDFSTPCFDGEHQMILGGSFISTGDEASIWARFHFRPHFFQHAGFRVVKESINPKIQKDKYDRDDTVDQYLLFHYGCENDQKDSEISTSITFPSTLNLINRTVELMNKFSHRQDRALDLGCAVGGASFRLASTFRSVTAIDFSDVFIEAALDLKKNGEIGYRRKETGRIFTELTAKIDKKIDRERVQFYQGDASSLSDTSVIIKKRPFSAILLSNLICRLSQPKTCLQQFSESDDYLKSGGILVIASPNTWLEQFTPEPNFLDGRSNSDTLSGLADLLPNFKLIFHEDLPFTIREHRRKYEFIISQISVWRKK